MMTINFERWLRIPQRAVGPSFLQRRAAAAHAACRRPARLAALVGAAFCASLAMTPADARPASASVGAGSAEPGVLAVDELSSRRHGGGGSAAAAKAKKAATHKSAHHKTHKSPHRKMNPWAAAAAKNRKELVRLDKAMHPKNADHRKSAKKKSAERETSP